MDGMGSPDNIMDHSMLDLKAGTNSYSCYSSKFPYDVSLSNRGKLKILLDDSKPSRDICPSFLFNRI